MPVLIGEHAQPRGSDIGYDLQQDAVSAAVLSCSRVVVDPGSAGRRWKPCLGVNRVVVREVEIDFHDNLCTLASAFESARAARVEYRWRLLDWTARKSHKKELPCNTDVLARPG